MFPPTSLTLLQKLAVEITGEREAAWVRFFSLYTPAIRRFAECNDTAHDPDDVVQNVYLKIVEIVRSGAYRPQKAKFRTFLAMLIRHELIALYRRDRARGGGVNVPIDEVADELAVPADQAERIDSNWARAQHEAAVEHVLTKTAMSAQSKAVYRAHVLENKSAEMVAAQFGITKNLVGQIKFRVERAIAVIEGELADNIV